MQKKSKLYFKKSAAIITAAALTLTASSAIVFGAGSYQEEEKKAFSKAMETFPKKYENLVDEYKTFSTGVESDFSIQLEDAGRSLLSLFVPEDISWLDNMEMKTKVIFQDGVEGVDMDLSLNDTYLCNLQTYLDFYTQLGLVKMPELFDGYIQTDMTVQTYDADGNPSTVDKNSYTEQLQKSMDFAMNIGDYMPEVSTMNSLLDRYSNIIISHITDVSSDKETLTLEEINQECTVYEGRISQQEASDMAEEFLTTAKADTELKEILTSWEETIPNAENLYQNFLKGIENALTDLDTSEPDSEDDSYISSKIWLSEDDTIVGRQIFLTDGTDMDPVITWQMPQENGKYEYLFDFNSEGSQLSLTGSGNISDHTMDGTYYLYSNSQPIISIELGDYDLDTAKEGYLNGTYTIAPLPGIANEETYNILSNFSLIAQFAAEKNLSSMALSITSGGAVLGTIKADFKIGSDMVIPEITTSDKVYNTANDKDNAAFAEALSFDTILDNIRQAGVPEKLVSELEASMETNSLLSGE